MFVLQVSDIDTDAGAVVSRPLVRVRAAPRDRASFACVTPRAPWRSPWRDTAERSMPCCRGDMNGNGPSVRQEADLAGAGA